MNENPISYKILLHSILSIAYDMLVAGSEVNKIEDAIAQMCQAYGVDEVDVFTITSTIVVTIHCSDGSIYTQTKRIKSCKIDFYKLEKLHDLVAIICRTTPEIAWIEAQRKAIRHPLRMERLQSYAIFSGISFVFSCLFGGSWRDGISAMISGIFINFILRWLEDPIQNKFVINVIASSVGALTAYLLLRLGIAQSVDKVIIGNIMLLIPGLATVNAIKDMISGDIIAGYLRLGDALIHACAIAIGFALVLAPLGV